MFGNRSIIVRGGGEGAVDGSEKKNEKRDLKKNIKKSPSFAITEPYVPIKPPIHTSFNDTCTDYNRLFPGLERRWRVVSLQVKYFRDGFPDMF